MCNDTELGSLTLFMLRFAVWVWLTGRGFLQKEAVHVGVNEGHRLALCLYTLSHLH